MEVWKTGSDYTKCLKVKIERRMKYMEFEF
jgi:hypothetical protein